MFGMKETDREVNLSEKAKERTIRASSLACWERSFVCSRSNLLDELALEPIAQTKILMRLGFSHDTNAAMTQELSFKLLETCMKHFNILWQNIYHGTHVPKALGT
jgi:hypothetical protein